MKKLTFALVALIALFASCSSDKAVAVDEKKNELEILTEMSREYLKQGYSATLQVTTLQKADTCGRELKLIITPPSYNNHQPSPRLLKAQYSL